MPLGRVVLVCFLSFVLSTLALEETVRVNLYTNDCQYTFFETFGFEKNGTMSLEMPNDPAHWDEEDVGFFLCTRKEKEKLLSKSCLTHMCAKRSSEPDYSEKYQQAYQPWDVEPVCELTMVSPLSDELAFHLVEKSSLYSLGVLSCRERRGAGSSYMTRITVHYTLINPKDNHLSTEQWIFPRISPFFFVVWIILICQMIATITIHHRVLRRYEGNPSTEGEIALSQSDSSVIHKLIVFVAISKAAVTWIEIWDWNSYQHAGIHETHLSLLGSFFFSLSECLLFSVLLLIGHGYCVVVKTVDPDEAQTLSSSLVALILSLLFFSMYNSTNSIMSLIVFYVFLLPNIFSNIQDNLDGLRFCLSWTTSTQDQVEREELESYQWALQALRSKINLYASFRMLVIGYLILILLINLLEFAVPWSVKWVCPVAYEILVLVFVERLFHMVRPSLWKEGLFWFYEQNGEYQDWTDMGNQLFRRIGHVGMNSEFQRKIRQFSQMAQKAALVQYPVLESLQSKKSPSSSVLPSPLSSPLSLPLSLPSSSSSSSPLSSPSSSPSPSSPPSSPSSSAPPSSSSPSFSLPSSSSSSSFLPPSPPLPPPSPPSSPQPSEPQSHRNTVLCFPEAMGCDWLEKELRPDEENSSRNENFLWDWGDDSERRGPARSREVDELLSEVGLA